MIGKRLTILNYIFFGIYVFVNPDYTKIDFIKRKVTPYTTLDHQQKKQIFIYFYFLNRYSQLRIESIQPILSIAFRANIPTTKSQTGNILGTSGI